MESPLAPLKLRIQVCLFNFYGAPPSPKILVVIRAHVPSAKKNCFWLLDPVGEYVHAAVVRERLNALQL